MHQKELYDVIVIGASVEGIALCEYLNAENPDLKVALVSKSFKYLTPKNKLTATVQIVGESVYSSYYHGVIGFTLKDKSALYGKAAVIATGSKPIKNNAIPGIVHKPIDIPEVSKNSQVVVNGGTADAVKYSIELSKKFKYVYLCSSEFDINCDLRLKKKLNDLPNVVHLPGCNIVSCRRDKNGKLQEVTLDTYSTIHCSALVGAYGRLPDISGISVKMLDIDKDGYAVVNNKNASTKVSNIYVVGPCAKRNTKHLLTVVGNNLLGGK